MKLIVGTVEAGDGLAGDGGEDRAERPPEAGARYGWWMWSTQAFVLDDDGGEVITVTTAGEKPNAKVGQTVHLVKL